MCYDELSKYMFIRHFKLMWNILGLIAVLAP